MVSGEGEKDGLWSKKEKNKKKREAGPPAIQDRTTISGAGCLLEMPGSEPDFMDWD